MILGCGMGDWGCGMGWGFFKGMLTRILKRDFADFADAWAFCGSIIASETH